MTARIAGVRVVRRDAQRVLEALDRIPEAPLLLVYVPEACAGLDGVSASQPPRLAFTEYPRRSRGVAATDSRDLHAATVPEVVQRAVVVRIEREHAAVAARGVVEVARVLQRRAEVEQNVRARPVEARGLHELRDGLVEFAPAVAVDGLRPVAVRELALLLRRGGARDASEEVLGFAREVPAPAELGETKTVFDGVCSARLLALSPLWTKRCQGQRVRFSLGRGRGAPPVHEATAHASEPPAVGRIHRCARRSWAVRRGAAAGRLASTRAGPCGPSLQ